MIVKRCKWALASKDRSSDRIWVASGTDGEHCGKLVKWFAIDGSASFRLAPVVMEVA